MTGDFDGWTPIHLFRSPAEPLVLWSRLGAGVRFDAPFFDQTVSAALRRPLASLLWRMTTVPEMIAIAGGGGESVAAGLIFHVSRCGSTLVAQMCARLRGLVVLSEPGLLTAMLEDPRLPEATRLAACRAVATLFARAAPRVVLKLEPRSLLDWPFLLRAFPNTPRVLLHRDPLEVLVSNLESLPEALLLGSLHPTRLGPPPRPLHSNEEYAAFVLSRFYEAAADLAHSGQALVVSYDTLPRAFVERIAPHFGIPLSAEEEAALAAAARIEAKDATRTRLFQPDSLAKRDRASEEAAYLSRQWFQESYGKLLERSSDAGTVQIADLPRPASL